MNTAYAEYFNENIPADSTTPRPARSTVEITRLPRPGMLVGIDCVATY